MTGTASTPARFPRGALFLAFALVAVSLLGAGYKQWVNPSAPRALPDTEVIMSRALRFEDADSGQVVVIDDTTNEPIEYLDVGTNGFLRATLRGLARARAAVSKGADIPFIVQRHVGGQVLLIDPATDSFIDLRAYGPTNLAVFARYLEDPFIANSRTQGR
ncbi:MAG: photosynthetic complex assembly protein PuhC [Gammaproteobacteria bacterium]